MGATPGRTPIWKAIADALRTDLAAFHATQKDAHVALIESVGASAITGE